MRTKPSYNQQKSKPLNTIIGLSVLLLPLLTLSPSAVFAEVLSIPETPKSFSITLPGRGMAMTEVIEKFGEPKSKDPEVGEPPITRWHYENYSVIFEYQYVIHALATNKPMGLMAPTSASAMDEQSPMADKPADKMQEDKMPKDNTAESTSNNDGHDAHH